MDVSYVTDHMLPPYYRMFRLGGAANEPAGASGKHKSAENRAPLGGAEASFAGVSGARVHGLRSV